jgi:hypothetical protein
MIQPRLLFPTLFAALTLAAIAAGCSSGSGGSLPTTPGTPTGDAARHRKRVGAILRIHIPPKPKRHRRGAQYVSPNTLALTVDVQDVTASPPLSMPTQTLVVNTPKPCVEATGDSGLTCTFAVKAYVGKNVFTFNEYATKNPTPLSTPLGTLTSGVTTVTSGGAALNFVLRGVVNHVELSVPNPESPASQNTEAIPIGTPAAFPLFINPVDASGASIATDTFSSPVTIQVSPANSGVSLALNKQCTGDTATAAKVTLNCASDLNQVTIAYDGTVTQTGANAYADTATVVASPLASPAPKPVTVALASNIIAYQLVPAPFASFPPNVDTSNLALDPVSGKIVFAYTYNSANATFVEFDPANPAAAAVTHAIGFGVRFLTFDSTGHLWTNDITSAAVHCFTSISAPGATRGISDVLGAINTPVIAPDASGNIWYSGEDENNYPAIGHFPDSCSAGSATAQFLINSQYQAPYGLALALPSGGNAAVGMVTSGGEFFVANTATAASPTPDANWPSGEYPQGLVNDKAYNIYSASYGVPAVNKIAAGTANVQTFLNLPPGSNPGGIDQYSGTQSTAQALAVLEDCCQGFLGTALINPATATTEPLEMGAGASEGCAGVSYDKNGGVWVVCYHGDGSLWAYHPVVTSTWSALPNAFPFTNVFQSAITIAEKAGIDNSPFTIVANSNPSVISAGAPWPATPAFPHAIPVQISGTGTAILTIADKHGRTQSVSIAVSPSGISTARHHQPHRRP